MPVSVLALAMLLAAAAQAGEQPSTGVPSTAALDLPERPLHSVPCSAVANNATTRIWTRRYGGPEGACLAFVGCRWSAVTLALETGRRYGSSASRHLCLVLSDVRAGNGSDVEASPHDATDATLDAALWIVNGSHISSGRHAVAVLSGGAGVNNVSIVVRDSQLECVGAENDGCIVASVSAKAQNVSGVTVDVQRSTLTATARTVAAAASVVSRQVDTTVLYVRHSRLVAVSVDGAAAAARCRSGCVAAAAAIAALDLVLRVATVSVLVRDASLEVTAGRATRNAESMAVAASVAAPFQVGVASSFFAACNVSASIRAFTTSDTSVAALVAVVGLRDRASVHDSAFDVREAQAHVSSYVGQSNSHGAAAYGGVATTRGSASLSNATVAIRDSSVVTEALGSIVSVACGGVASAEHRATVVNASLLILNSTAFCTASSATRGASSTVGGVAAATDVDVINADALIANSTACANATGFMTAVAVVAGAAALLDDAVLQAVHFTVRGAAVTATGAARRTAGGAAAGTLAS